MDNNWNEYTEPVQPEPRPQVKPSPFADSPYVTAFPQPEYVPPVPKVKKKRSKTGWWVLLTAVLVAAAVAVTAVGMSMYWNGRISALTEATNNKLAVMQQQLDAASRNIASVDTVQQSQEGLTPGQVYARNVDAVVAVVGTVSDGYGQYDSFGSGFIISADGYVVTNYHVVQNTARVTVILSGQQELAATVIGYDDTNDMALLKVEGEDLPFVTVGSSDALSVGDKVVAIGNPLGELTSTLTVGYVSAMNRVITTDGTAINMLQTDAAINSGNSGGPLFNMQGQVIGITTAKYSGTSSSGASIEGIGFAIPMDDVIDVIEDLREDGFINSGFLGVYVRDVSADGIRDGLPAGALVDSLIPGYCSESAGVQPMDIIVNFGGYQITNTTDLTRYLRKFDGGETTTVTVYRAGQYLDLTITLDAKPREEAEDPTQETVMSPGQEGFEDWYWDFIDRFYGNQ